VKTSLDTSSKKPATSSDPSCAPASSATSPERIERNIGQARDVLRGEAGADWRADWVYEWAETILELAKRSELAVA
jgi:hypothetical protein